MILVLASSTLNFKLAPVDSCKFTVYAFAQGIQRPNVNTRPTNLKSMKKSIDLQRERGSIRVLCRVSKRKGTIKKANSSRWMTFRHGIRPAIYRCTTTAAAAATSSSSFSASLSYWASVSALIANSFFCGNGGGCNWVTCN